MGPGPLGDDAGWISFSSFFIYFSSPPAINSFFFCVSIWSTHRALHMSVLYCFSYFNTNQIRIKMAELIQQKHYILKSKKLKTESKKKKNIYFKTERPLRSLLQGMERNSDNDQNIARFLFFPRINPRIFHSVSPRASSPAQLVLVQGLSPTQCTPSSGRVHGGPSAAEHSERHLRLKLPY